MDSAAPFQPWASDDSAKNVKSERDLVDDAKLHRENVNHPKHTQTASYDKESVAVSSNAPGSSGGATSGAEPARGIESKMDSTKIASMQQIVENTISQEGRQRVGQLLEAVEALSGAERLLLYLRLPTGVPPHDPLKQPINPLGSRAELQQTVTWIQTHLEVDPDVSLPKQDVYDEYIAHCVSSNMKPLSTADFGKVMKQVYPSVRPRRLGTRGNSRYCYAGLRKKIKLEVPQLPDLGESSKEVNVPSRETERIVCDWAEIKLGMKFSSISELSRHLTSAPPGPPSNSPPPQTQLPQDEATNQQLMKQLKRKIQGTPGRPKKNKSVGAATESPPSTSYSHLPKPEELPPEPTYGYQPPYVPVYEVRTPYAAPAPTPAYSAPPRAHPPPSHEFRAAPLPFPAYARDLSLPAEPSLPINLSCDASLDLSLDLSPERDWRRRAPEPRPLPGKKLILEAYHSERAAEYLPKKMRAAESLGGKLAAARASSAAPPPAPPPAPPAPPLLPPPDRADRPAFLEDPKNLTSRSTSTAAALARERHEAASPPRSAEAPPERRPLEPDLSKTPVICEERHAEILNRERVISICNIDKHDLDDYLNEGNSQEHEEELLRYFNQRDADHPSRDPSQPAPAFLETGPDPPDEHSQGKNEKISQLRELLAKNLKNQSGSANNVIPDSQPDLESRNSQEILPDQIPKLIPVTEGAFKPLLGNTGTDVANGPILTNQNITMNGNKNGNTNPVENGASLPYVNENTPNQTIAKATGPHNYNGHSHNEPQSPKTRTQQYEFVPISDGCHSPGHFSSKSPLGFGQRGHSPTKVNKPAMMGGSLQTSPISHSTAASPFVSPRNTPVPRSRLCSRPIPKLNGRKRRNPLSLGMADAKQFAMPNDQKIMTKTTQDICRQIGIPNKYCQPLQPMSAPPSPNILTSQYKTQMFGMPNGNSNLHSLNFLPNAPFRDHMNGELSQPLSADPLSSEVSQFFPETPLQFRPALDAFRSQSVPLKNMNLGLLSYNNTPVGSVPPTPVPNEFCDFGSLTETCDISKAGLNPETLDKIYNAIDSSNDVLNSSATAGLLNSADHMRNGCDPLPNQQILSDEHLRSLMPGDQLLDRNSQFNQTFSSDDAAPDNVDEFLKRTNSLEFDLSELETDKSKYYTSRSVPSTPLPYKRAAGGPAEPRRARQLFPDGPYPPHNGISSKSVPSTPQLADERSVFSYSNRDFLINGNSVCGTAQLPGIVVDDDRELTSPPYDMLQGDILEPLTLADLDNVDL
ncbi:histone-lysine N-methyltransferase 2D isoform X2 [Plodia interpunctella]|uniref:histone-lysine N-methyltransferase 2D isoform X2 n=1 Tax=Plodia interpunctella TaxID=58824 RepID=UPI002367566A|nr:histone-lysine N-methyltransferase 2D isoform X2 [Plodia interpunctella]